MIRQSDCREFARDPTDERREPQVERVDRNRVGKPATQPKRRRHSRRLRKSLQARDNGCSCAESTSYYARPGQKDVTDLAQTGPIVKRADANVKGLASASCEIHGIFPKRTAWVSKLRKGAAPRAGRILENPERPKFRPENPIAVLSKLGHSSTRPTHGCKSA